MKEYTMSCEALKKYLKTGKGCFFHGTNLWGNMTPEEAAIYKDEKNIAARAKKEIYKIISHPEWEICCSTDFLGPCGVVLSGDICFAANKDVYTFIKKDGSRHVEVLEADDGSIMPLMGGDFYTADTIADIWSDYPPIWVPNPEETRTEVILVNTKVIAVWCGPIDFRSEGKVLDFAKSQNLPFIGVVEDGVDYITLPEEL